MIHRVIISFKPEIPDTLGIRVKNATENFLNLKINSIRTKRVYTIDADLSRDELKLITSELFVDPLIEQIDEYNQKFDWLIEVGYRPGVTDNVGKTAKIAISHLLNRSLKEEEGVYTSIQYLLEGSKLTYQDVEKITKEFLANDLIERWLIRSSRDVKRKRIEILPPVIRGEEKITVKEYDLNVSDNELMKISKEGVLALSLEEMKAIKKYYSGLKIIAERRKMGLSNNPTDVELETLAQTWSEHCKHKIFNALIHYREGEFEEDINSLFKTYIKRGTEELCKKFPWLLSVFVDNAGVISFNERWNISAKVETHNTPSALEPYGGAMTGIVGVNRDPLGTGRGSKLMFNMFAYCFGNLFYKGKMAANLLHPNRIRQGVHQGVIDGGNQSGIPLVMGREIFEERYGEAKPLVYCGPFGIMPKKISGDLAHIKKIEPEDVIVMVGGRIGKDGIHGATFSSEELHKDSPIQAVQIGDPITQKKMRDLLLEARKLNLYKSITDNGAGGLASSVGEMAILSNGCDIDLKKAPLKYQGLHPWEILLSEAQERMTLGVDVTKIDEFLKLAENRDVEATILGRFRNSGKFHVKYDDRTVAYLDLVFLHSGVPQKKLVAIWEHKQHEEPQFQQPKNLSKILNKILSRLNICSTAKKIRQYDHEVKGLSIIKPLIGKEHDVLSDSTISILEHGSTEGLIFASGLNPHYSDIDTYHMTASVIDEAVRRVISVGGKLPSSDIPFAALDNFSWCDPEQSEKTPDGHYKLAQLVRACKALYDYSKAFDLPFISGKDSMKNDGVVFGTKISIPPTLLITVIAKMDDVRKAVTLDLKKPGDLVYIIGETFEELGGSEYFRFIGEHKRGKEYIGNTVPKVNARKAKKIYNLMSQAPEMELVHSITTPTKGGLAIALAKSAFAGGYGIYVRLDKVPYHGDKRDDKILFSESNSRFIVTVPKDKKDSFESIMQGIAFSHIGFVLEKPIFWVKGADGSDVIKTALDDLKKSWTTTLEMM
ncbi:MAG: phosphoribosylformylglycinamidine synthase [Candidatus Bathyarchaeota archaeon]|nr:MAG: phosphoribosylformylglycinamidine synthase [Candidatus Bathyarchaeota archaeon]